MKYLIICLALLSSCTASKPQLTTDDGTAITVENQEQVLKVLNENKDKRTNVISIEDHFIIFITEKPRLATINVKKPVIISANSRAEIEILINQYVDSGWELKGSVSASTSFGKTVFYSTLVK